MSKSKGVICSHTIDGVNGPRMCTKDAGYTIDAGNGAEPRCAKHFHVAISRAMKQAAIGDEVRFTFTSLETA